VHTPLAKERYAALGIDTDKVIETLEQIPISLHCWQTDDVVGFERSEALSGASGDRQLPGRARNIDEVRQDIAFVQTLLAGNHRLNLHETYGDFGGKFVDRDQVEPATRSWMQWAEQTEAQAGLQLHQLLPSKSGKPHAGQPRPAIRAFWIEHTKRCRRIADVMGQRQGDPCIMNIWVHDGSKDMPVRRKYYREILADSLDQILAEPLPHMKSCVEAKLFGIGLESYTVGSHDFYAGYCATRKVIYTLDTGHYEQTENVSDMVASLSSSCRN
jgi:L-rhamnose isomerase